MSKKLTYEEFSKRFNEIWKGKLELIPETKLDYKGVNYKIRVRCPKHGTIEKKSRKLSSRLWL